MAIDLDNITISKAHEALKAGEYTVRELTDAYLAVIAEKNDDLNVYLHLFTDIDEQVFSAQAMYDNNTATEMTGIPMAIKANLQVKGQVCNGGGKMLGDYVAVYDATAIARLREAGAIFLGSANMDELAMGSSTENSAFGVTKNPVDQTRVPGGSSGGSAAAVAANMALCALGSDTGGSIRQPASFTGIVGYKGTYGSVSRYGLAAMGSSLDQVGPLTKNVADTAIVWRVMRGEDTYDMTSLADETWKTVEIKDVYKIAVPQDFLEGVDEEVLRVYNNAVERLRSAGHTVEEIDIPVLKYALPVYYVVMPAEVSSNTARYDGIRFGYKAPETANILEEYTKTRAQGFGAEVKRRIMLGTYVLSAGYGDQYYTKALALREQMKSELDQVFETYDAIITPTSPVPAFTIGEKSDDPLSMYLADIFTVGANIAGIPGISVPGGTTEINGVDLPVGVQFLSRKTSDEMLLDLATKFEQLTG